MKVFVPLFRGDEVVWEVGVEERRHGIQELPHRPLPHPRLRHEVDAQRALRDGGTQRGKKGTQHKEVSTARPEGGRDIGDYSASTSMCAFPILNLPEIRVVDYPISLYSSF